MNRVSTIVACFAAGPCAILALAAPAALSQAAETAEHSPPPPVGGSLCTAAETPIFSCALGGKRVSVCGSGTQAVYRYGTPGRIELTAHNPTLAKQGFSGGGETQIQVRNNDYTYVVFDKTVRTAFGGPNDPDSRSGLLVRHAGKTLSSKECDDDAPIPSRASSFMPTGGTIVMH